MKKQDFDFTIPLLGLILFICIMAASCSRSGYGCHGNSKIMTRVR